METVTTSREGELMCNHGYSFLILLLLIGCTFNPDPVTPDDPKDVMTQCDLACKNLKRMDCDGWKGSPGEDEVFGTNDDVSCQITCTEIVNSDPTVTLHQLCVAKATSCTDADKCFEVEE